MKRIWIAFSIGLLVSVMTCGSVWAQATAQMSGAVADQSGAVLPGVEVTARQTASEGVNFNCIYIVRFIKTSWPCPFKCR